MKTVKFDPATKFGTAEATTAIYDKRRYSRPWVAKFSASDLDFVWGTWIGDHSEGSDGLLTIDFCVGDVIATWQKDGRGKGSAPTYYVVAATGELEMQFSKAQAVLISLKVVADLLADLRTQAEQASARA